jgi:hypothetical protein
LIRWIGLVTSLFLFISPLFAQVAGNADGDGVTPGGFGGAASVGGNMGALTYSIPIPVPAGRTGLTPSLTLSYSSSNRSNGLVGFGWSLPIGTLERRGHRGSTLSANAPITNLADERYNKNIWGIANELQLLKDGTFDTRHRSYWKVVPSSLGFFGGVFDQWEAWDPEGNRYSFSRITESSSNTQYLTSVVSPNQTGIFIDYVLGQDDALPQNTFKVGNQELASYPVYPDRITYSCASPGDEEILLPGSHTSPAIILGISLSNLDRFMNNGFADSKIGTSASF